MEVNDVIEKFFRLKKIISLVYRSVSVTDKELGLSDVIIFLKIPSESEMTLGRLSELTGVSNTLITFTIDSLEKRGLVLRTRGNDRRTILVTLTDLGNEKYESLKNEITLNFNYLFSKLSEEEMSRLYNDFEDMIQIMKKITNTDSPK